MQILKYKVFINRPLFKFKTLIIGFKTKIFLDTKNELAEGGREGYENINVMYNILPPNLQLLRDIESITPGDAEADCTYWHEISQIFFCDKYYELFYLIPIIAYNKHYL